MNLDLAEADGRAAMKPQAVRAVFLDEGERRIGKPWSYRSAEPLGFAGLQSILREALLARAASIEVTLSEADEGLDEFLDEAGALYRLATAAAKAGIERVTLRRCAAEGRWMELRLRTGGS